MAAGFKYGLIAAGGMSAWTLAEYALGLHTTRLALGDYSSWGTAVILVGALWRLLHGQLYQANRTWLPVGLGLLQGLFASLVAAMGFYVFLSLYLHYLHPDYPDLRLEWQVSQMRAAGKPELEIRQMARAFRWSFSPMGLPVTVIGVYLLLGFIASPLLTLWLNWRRKQPGYGGGPG